MAFSKRYRKDGSYVYVIDYWPEGMYGKRVRKTLPEVVQTDEEAELWEQAYTQKPEAAPGLPTDLSVSALFERYIEDEHFCLGLAETTRRDIEGAFRNHILRVLGGILVPDLTTTHMKAYKKVRVAERKMLIRTTKGGVVREISDDLVKNRTINKEMSYFSAFLAWARKELDVPVQSIAFDALPYKRRKPIVLMLDETVALLEAAEPFYKALFGCLYGLGLRDMEAKLLCWENYDAAGSQILVKDTKGGEPRVLYVPDWVGKVLADIRPREAKGYIFLSGITGRPIVNIRRAIERARIKAGILKHVHPHLLRHSLATHLVGLNVNLRTVQKQLGHKKLTTTEFYTHVQIGDLKGAQDMLSGAIGRVKRPKKGRGKQNVSR